jgi:hypothetical protein
MRQGFTRPFSPQGRASMLPPMPWRFAADQMLVHFRADPDVLDSYLPPPMTPNPDRRGDAFLWTPNLNVHPVDEEVNATIKNPHRTHYNVCVIAIPGLFNGEPRLISAFQWTDRDWLVVLSWVIGTCAKQVEFRDNGTHPMFARIDSNRTGGLGSQVSRTLSRNGEQLMYISCTPEENIEAADMSFFTSTMPLLSERHIPNFNVPPTGKPLVHDLTQMLLTDSAGQNFRRGPATLEFNALADNEELGSLQPTEVLDGYRWETSWIMPGIKVVHDYLAEG